MEPGFNFEVPATLRIRLRDSWDIRSTNRGVLELEGGNLDIDALAYKGDPGKDGEPGPPARYMAEVANVGALPSPQTLGPADIGKWWSVTGSPDAWFWNGTNLARKPNYIQVGPAGPAITLTPGTITEGAEWGFSLDKTGDAAYRLNIVAKPGPKGADSTVPGPTATIMSASDADNLAAADVGTFLFKSAPDRVGAKKIALSPGTYTKVGTETDWLTVDSGVNWNGTVQQITTLTVPAQPYAWQPDVTAFCEFMTQSASGQRFDLEVRLNAVSGPLVARGAGASTGEALGVWTTRHAIPAADVTAAPGGGAIVPAGTQAVLYVIASRVEGGATPCRFYTRKERAFLRVRLMPVNE